MHQGFLLLLLVQLSSYALVTPKNVCSRPSLGPYVETKDLQRVYDPGQEVFLQCIPGYTSVSGSHKTVCAESGTWSSLSLKCEPKRCSSPSQLLNGEIQIDDTIFQSIINYTCKEGYKLHGHRTSQCLHDGTWSNSQPVCEPVVCDLPQIPKYATVKYSREFLGNRTFFGDSVIYECTPPFARFGNKVGFCLSNGSWSQPPECRLVTCPPPTGISNGFLQFDVIRQHVYKEKVKYGCDMNYILDGSPEIECQKTGYWTSKPMCRAPCTVAIKRGLILYQHKKMWIEDFSPNRVLHSEWVAVYCKDKEKDCGYPALTQCIDGTLKIPECYKEPHFMRYTFYTSSLPSEIDMCPPISAK